MKEYNYYQVLYATLVSEHSDAFLLMDIKEESELVENALRYFKAQEFPLIYPAKSYAVAIIYATKIEEIYNIPLRDVLNDSNLFLGEDSYFVPYDQDPETYEEILKRLAEIPNWIESGWAPKSVSYFKAECTAAGIEALSNG